MTERTRNLAIVAIVVVGGYLITDAVGTFLAIEPESRETFDHAFRYWHPVLAGVFAAAFSVFALATKPFQPFDSGGLEQHWLKPDEADLVSEYRKT